MIRRVCFTAVLSGLFLLALGSAALAHPFTGQDATGAQIAVTVVGALLTVGGVGGALMATGESKRFKGDPARLRKGGLILAAVGFLVFLVGPDLVGPALTPCVRPESQARIEILSPSAGQVFESEQVDLRLNLEGGVVTDLSSTENVEGEGHLHISLNGSLTSMTGGEEQVIEVPAGSHVLEVEYVANDHAPFCTRVADRVRFAVDDGTGQVADTDSGNTDTGTADTGTAGEPEAGTEAPDVQDEPQATQPQAAPAGTAAN